MLLSSWLKRISDRIRSRRYQPDRKPKKPDRYTQLGLTRLEDRVVLSVNAAFDGVNTDQLNIDINADTAIVTTNGTNITVNDGTTDVFTDTVGSINAIRVTGTGGVEEVQFEQTGGISFTLAKGLFVNTDVDTTTLNASIDGVSETAGTTPNAIDIDSGTVNLNSNLTTVARDILLAGNVAIGDGESLTLTTGAGAGSIQITGSLDGTAGATAESLTLTAGTGDVILNGVGAAGVDDLESLDVTSAANAQINGAVDLNSSLMISANSVTLGDDVVTGAAIDVTAAAGSITVQGELDTSTNSSDVNLTATAGVLLDGAGADVTTGGGTFTVDADSDGDASGSYSQNDVGSAVAVGSGSVTIEAADATITGTITGTGTLVLQPSKVAGSIGLGGAAGDFNLDDAELLQLSDGFSGVTIGRVDGTGVIATDTADFTDPITLLGGEATFAGLTTSQDNAGITITTAATAGVTVSGSLAANGSGTIDINSGAAFALNDGVTLSSTSGAITIDTTGSNVLAVDGNVTTAGAGTITLTGSDAVTTDASSQIQADAAISIAAGANDVTIDEVTSTTSTVTIDASAGGSILAADATNIISGTVVTLNASSAATESVGGGATHINTSAVTLAGTAGTGGFFVDEADNVTITSIVVTGVGTVSVTSATGGINRSGGGTNIASGGNVALAAATGVGRVGPSFLHIQAADIAVVAPEFDITVVTGTDLTSLSIVTDLSGSTRRMIADNLFFAISDTGTNFQLIGILKQAGSSLDFDFTALDGGISAGQIEVLGGSVALTSNSSFITDGGFSPGIISTGGNVTLSAASGVGAGSSNPFSIVAANLEASGGTGDVFVSNSGDLTIGGIGATNGVSTTNSEINIATTGALTVSESVSSTGGDVVLTASNGVTLSGVDADVATGGGTFTVDADSNSDGTGTYSQDDVGSAVTTANGTVSINAGDVTLTGTIDAGTGTALIAPSTAVAIGLGGAAGTFTLTDATADQITASTLEIGTSTSGAIAIDDFSPANFTTLVLRTDEGVSQGTVDAGIDLNIANLAIDSDTGVDIDVDVSTLAINNADAASNIQIDSNSASLTIGNVTTSTGAIQGITTNGSATIAGATALTVENAITADGTVSLSAVNGVALSSANGDVTTNGGIFTVDADSNNDGTGTYSQGDVGSAVTTSNGTVSITAGDISLTGTIDAGTGTALIAPSTAVSIGLGGAAGTFTLTDAAADQITGTRLEIGTSTSGAIRIDDFSPANLTTLVLATDEDVAQGTVDAGIDLAIANLAIDSDTGVDIDANVTTLAINNADVGSNVQIDSSATSLTIGSVTTSAGALAGITTADGSVNVEGATAITVDNALTSNGGGIVLTTTTGDLTVNASVSASTGDIQINAADLVLTGALSSSGTLVLQPSTTGSTIGIGGGSGAFDVDDAELALLTDGFASITIGDATNGTGAVDVDESTFVDPVTIVGGAIAVTALVADDTVDNGDGTGLQMVTLTARTGNITDGETAPTTDVTGSLITLNAEAGAIGQVDGSGNGALEPGRHDAGD